MGAKCYGALFRYCLGGSCSVALLVLEAFPDGFPHLEACVCVSRACYDLLWYVLQ